MITLAITGMTCPHCVKAVQSALTAVPEARNIQVDLASGRATVEGSPSIPALLAAVVDEGYEASVLE